MFKIVFGCNETDNRIKLFSDLWLLTSSDTMKTG